MTAEPDHQPESQRGEASVGRWWRRLRLAAGLASLGLGLLSVIGLVWLFTGSDLAWGNHGTGGPVLELPSLVAAPPRAVGPSARVAAGARRPQPDPVWVDRVAGATGIPARALVAYAQATLLLSDQQPGCRVGWTTLAGLGQIESEHGTLGGSHLLEDGRPSVRILGPALDGRSGFRAIRATPQSTALVGDPNWAHAVGPMQFIPSTWQQWASDGDGDGRRDPDDIDDATRAAARYLCASGVDLTTAVGWQRAIHSYNQSDAYTAQVLDTANQYALASVKN
jgi:membrane-bound lytic murein transglycosylase B